MVGVVTKQSGFGYPESVRYGPKRLPRDQGFINGRPAIVAAYGATARQIDPPQAPKVNFVPSPMISSSSKIRKILSKIAIVESYPIIVGLCVTPLRA